MALAIKRNQIELVKPLIEMGSDVKNEPVRRAMQFIKADQKQMNYIERAKWVE